MIAYAGQLDVYGQGNQVLERFLGIKVSAMQVNRMTDYYGERCGDAQVLLAPSLPAVKGKEVPYVAVDGSMLFTRDDGWKEVKVARLFKSSDCIDPNGKASWIRHSQYYGLLGGSVPFTGGVEAILDGYNVPQGQLVFLSDGAQWIRNWVEDAFPGSVAILDYYHALEHLHKFKVAVFGDKEEGAGWAEEQAALLLESQTEAVISNIRVAAKEKGTGEAEKLIGYYGANKNRMDYKRYKTIGAGIIGSGAVESAHRTLIQDRMKNAGQRWSNGGAKHMIDLKTMYLNEKWNVVTGFAKNYDKAA